MRALCCLEPGLVDPAQDVQFYWLAADGTQQSGSELTLRAALSGSALIATTLVWRKGWSEWLPANRVPELAPSIPEPKREQTQEPRRDLGVGNPPAPAGKLPALSSRAPIGASTRPTSPALRAPLLSTPAKPSRPIHAQHEAARDTLAPSSFGHLGPSRRPAQSHAAAHPSGTPPPPPMRSRSPMPTLGEEQGVVSATATLRPPGAVPPPARGVPGPTFDSSPRPSATMTPIPSFGLSGGKLEVPRNGALPSVVNKQLLSEPPPASIEPALDSTLEVVQQVPTEARRTPVDALPAARPVLKSSAGDEARRPAAYRDSLVKIGRIGVDSRTVVMALSALSGALLVAVIGLWLSHAQKGTASGALTSASGIAAAAAAPPAASAPSGCKLLLPAARVAPSIERTVPPYASKIANEGALALGIAASKTKGVGLRVDPNTLDVLPTFEEEGKDAVRGVVPLTRSGALAFFVDRDDRALHSAHTVDEVPPFTLGVSDAGFSRVVAGSTSLVWPLSADVKITEPRSAPLGDFGYGITFRRGGQSGAVMLGFVGSDGSKKSELAEIPDAPKFLGTPMIAGSNNGALVAFAGRDTAEGAWKLYVSHSLPGAPPSSARALRAGAGGSVISPTLAALPGDRWLVQWTEGTSGQYHVHVQSFAADLSPIGQSVLVSPKGANAGQGSLATFANGALTLFILTTAGHDELWGATLTCQ
ncbi:MAG: GYF domain-containing protein [Polyangiaceae bacterium]